MNVLLCMYMCFKILWVCIYGGDGRMASVCIWILSRMLSASPSFVAIVRVAYIMLCCIMAALNLVASG